MTKDISAELDSVFDMLFDGFALFFDLLGSFEFHGISLFDFVIAITLLSGILSIVLTLIRVDSIATFKESRYRSRANRRAARNKSREEKELQELKDSL